MPSSRTARRQRAVRQFGVQAGIEAGRDALGQRFPAEAGELEAHRLQLIVRHQIRVVHVR
jgi:hypothetical protein